MLRASAEKGDGSSCKWLSNERLRPAELSGLRHSHVPTVIDAMKAEVVSRSTMVDLLSGVRDQRSRIYWQSLCFPSAKATNDVSCSPEPDILQSSSSEARRISFRAKDDHAQIGTTRDWQPSTGSRIETPLEYVALDDKRSGDGSFLRALAARSDVNKHRIPGCRSRVVSFPRRHPMKAGSRTRQSSAHA